MAQFPFGLDGKEKVAETLRVMAHLIEQDEILVETVVTSTTKTSEAFVKESFTLQYYQKEK